MFMFNQGKVRLGLIGAGMIGKTHLEVFSQLPEQCEVVAVANPSPARAEQLASQFGIPHVSRTEDELIARDDIDAVIIANANIAHAPLVLASLESGKHVFVEKPMGDNAAAAQTIVEAQRRTGKVVTVAHNMRWEANVMQAHEHIRSGQLGRIYMAKAGIYRRHGIPGWGSWFTRKDVAGGGALIDIGVHLLDVALFLMGEPKAVSVSGVAYSELGPRKRGIGDWGTPNWEGYFDVDDIAAAMIKFDTGAALLLEASWAVHVHTDDHSFVHLMGTEGGIYLHGATGELLTDDADGKPLNTPLALPAQDEGGRLRLARHFLECVREGKETTSSAATGLRSNLIIDAIYESARSGNEVKIG